MDGREAMAFSGGSGSYYLHRGGGVAGSGGFPASPPGFRALPNTGIQAQSNNARVAGGGGSSAVTFSAVESQSHPGFGRGGFGSSGGGSSGGVPAVSSGEPVKKKRGRPRKYAPTDGGAVSLKLSPLAGTAHSSTPGSTTPSDKRARGRPPGSGRKQQLAALGEWMNSSAGQAFSPHVVTIGAGEDIVAKLLLLSQQRPRALCILSGTGTVSSVTLRQPGSTNASITLEGRFQILCLSGSYLVAEDGGPPNRIGGISVSLSSPDGHIVGGGVAVLIASSTVQVVVCSFLYGGKTKTKQVTATKDDDSSEPQHGDKLTSPASAPPSQNYIPSAAGHWQGSRSEDAKREQTHTGIDLTRG